MFKTLLVAATALPFISGIALTGIGFAQNSASSTSTTVTTPGMAPTQQDDTTSTTNRTATRNGVLIEKDVSGTETITPGRPAVTQTSTQSTSTHQ